MWVTHVALFAKLKAIKLKHKLFPVIKSLANLMKRLVLMHVGVESILLEIKIKTLLVLYACGLKMMIFPV